MSNIETEKEYLAKSMDKVHLEMEISTYLKDWEDDEEIGLHLSTDNGCIPIELEDVRDLARHFAKWGAEHAKIDVTDFCKPIDPGIAQCIADHSWEMLGEDEKPVPNDLEEAADKHIRKVVDAAGHPGWDWTTQDITEAFIAGAEWQAEADKETIKLAEDHAYLAGANWQKEQMLKNAVEGYVNYYEDSGGILMAEAQVGCPYHNGDKVRIVVLKAEEEEK